MKLIDKIAQNVRKRKKQHKVDFDSYANVLILDCGIGASTYFNRNQYLEGGKGTGRVKGYAQLRHLINELENNSFLAVEDSHFTPSGPTSRSQPFPEWQLQEIFDLCRKKNITLKLFPQKLTPRAITFAGSSKSDGNDPKSICMFLEHANVSLKNPPKKFGYSERQNEGHAMRADINVDLNIARAYVDDDGIKREYGDPEDKCMDEVRKLFPVLVDVLNEKELSIYVSDPSRLYYKKDCEGGKKGDINWNVVKVSQLYTLVAMFVCPDGELRIRPSTGNVAGFDFIEAYLLVRSAWHYRGGVARSTLMFWGFRLWVRMQSKLLGNPLIDLERKVTITVGTKKDGTPKTETRLVTRGSFNEHEEAFFLEQRDFYQGTQDKVLRITKTQLGLREVDPQLGY